MLQMEIQPRLKKQKKAENAGLDYTDDVRDVCTFIASKITDNIRELEGTLNRVIGASNLLLEKIDIDLASRALQELVNSDENGLEPERIKSIIPIFDSERLVYCLHRYIATCLGKAIFAFRFFESISATRIP